MSGHSKFANIKHKKEKNDAKKGKIFTIIGREIVIAVKEGGPDPANNSKLRDVIAKAKANNMPNDTIDRGIKKAAVGIRIIIPAGLARERAVGREIRPAGTHRPHGRQAGVQPDARLGVQRAAIVRRQLQAILPILHRSNNVSSCTRFCEIQETCCYCVELRQFFIRKIVLCHYRIRFLNSSIRCFLPCSQAQQRGSIPRHHPRVCGRHRLRCRVRERGQ